MRFRCKTDRADDVLNLFTWIEAGEVMDEIDHDLERVRAMMVREFPQPEPPDTGDDYDPRTDDVMSRKTTRDYAKTRYAKCKEEGRCFNCGKMSGGTLLCPDCATKNKLRRAAKQDQPGWRHELLKQLIGDRGSDAVPDPKPRPDGDPTPEQIAEAAKNIRLTRKRKANPKPRRPLL